MPRPRPAPPAATPLVEYLGAPCSAGTSSSSTKPPRPRGSPSPFASRCSAPCGAAAPWSGSPAASIAPSSPRCARARSARTGPRPPHARARLVGRLAAARPPARRAPRDPRRWSRTSRPSLEAAGCYERQPRPSGWCFPSTARAGGARSRCRRSSRRPTQRLAAHGAGPTGDERTARLPLAAYLQLVAATNFKQRIRKMIEYYHADRLNYAVAGTPNRLEYDQGFFVKHGDGAADFKPIAHLYKTQVYALAAHLGVPAEIRRRAAHHRHLLDAADQEEFYFALPYQRDGSVPLRSRITASPRRRGGRGARPHRRAGRARVPRHRAKRRGARYLTTRRS